VWKHARGIVLVNARKSITDAARALGRPTLELPGCGSCSASNLVSD
jgi:hypothetical protein